MNLRPLGYESARVRVVSARSAPVRHTPHWFTAGEDRGPDGRWDLSDQSMKWDQMFRKCSRLA